jgi:hypothetical protein
MLATSSNTDILVNSTQEYGQRTIITLLEQLQHAVVVLFKLTHVPAQHVAFVASH